MGRPLTAGWAWAGFWAVLIVADEFLDLAGWSWYVLVGMAALPTLLATIALLHATPRRYLKPRRDTVLGHFFVRFLALIAAFLVWGVSVVMSASISTTLQSLVGASEREVTAVGFNLLLAAIPLVVSVLWLAFIIRCAWFLRRLRGWKQDAGTGRRAQEVPAGQAPAEAGGGGPRPSGSAARGRPGHLRARAPARRCGTDPQCAEVAQPGWPGQAYC